MPLGMPSTCMYQTFQISRTSLSDLHMFINRYVSRVMRIVCPLSYCTPVDVIQLLIDYNTKGSIIIHFIIQSLI